MGDKEMGEDAAFYHCVECDWHICSKCSRRHLGLPVVDDAEENPIEILPGDVLLSYPDIAGTHHVIFVTGPLEHSDVSKDEDLSKVHLEPDQEMWQCRTIE